MATLEELREKLDGIDDQIAKLYEERMKVCEDVGNTVYGTSFPFGKRLYTCGKNIHLDVSDLRDGVRLFSAFPKTENKKHLFKG